MEVLVKPVISEKMTRISEQLGKYAFITHKKANKVQIKNAIEEMYGVTVEKVNTIIVPAKAKSRFTKSGLLSGRKQSYKKAIVSLAEGDSIDFYADI